MDKEYHYYINYIIAKMGGFSAENAHIIAHCAQLTDDNTKSIKVQLNKGKEYVNQISQTIDLRLTPARLNAIYRCFHFQPPGKGSQMEDEDDAWVTQANSPFASAMLCDALEARDPYIIGVASHAFADTYAHQGFCGHSSRLNNPLKLEGIISYGHMYFGELPDLIGIKWYDLRSGKKVDNHKRFMRASLDLLEHYLQLHGASPAHIKQHKEDLKDLLTNIWGPAVTYFPGVTLKNRSRIQQYKRHLEKMGCELLQYNHRGWLNEAANYDRSKQSWIPKNQGFRKSHWYKFQEAVKVYQKLFEKNCKNLLHTTKETIDQNTETG